MSDAETSRKRLLAELARLRERVAQLEGRPEPRAAAGHDAPEDRRRHEGLLRAMRALVIETNAQGTPIYISGNVLDLLGREASELVGLPAREWIHPDDVVRLVEVQDKVLSSGESVGARWRARHRAGHWVWFESTGHPHRTTDGHTRLLWFARDATEAVRHDDALRDAEALLRAIGSRASDLVTVFDGDGRYLYLSPNRQRILGRAPDSFLGRTIREVAAAGELHEREAAGLIARFERLKSGASGGHLTYRLLHADGSWRWLQSSGSAYRTSDGQVRVVILARDITDKVQASERLRESEARYRVVVEASGNLVSENDAEGRLVYVTDNCEQILGYTREELVGTTPVPLLLHTEDVERATDAFLEVVRAGRPLQIPPYRMRRRDGTFRWFETVCVPYQRDDGAAHVLGVSRDVTDRIRSEEQRRELADRIQQTQRLESLGVMAGGIAHDFNNLLTPILGDASLALLDLPTDSPLRGSLQRIRRAAQRAAGLTHQMLAYAGHGPLAIEPIDLSGLVAETGQLLETAVGGRATLVYSMAPQPPLVEGDATQLSQVALNLITNAAESLDDSPGHIWIRTGSVDAAAVPAASLVQGSLEDDPYVYFEVEDDGCGMDAETRTRIFDPFFTTKFTGRGLGLAAVLGIVRGHGGAIELDSVPGRGTRFRVLLPARVGAAPPPFLEERTTVDWRGHGTVLVVDDEAGVRELAGDTLRRSGLSVLLAEDGEQAVTLLDRYSDRIDAVLLDRTMPSTSGADTFHAIRAVHPTVPVILMSGYSQERAAERFDARDLAGFLQKPFAPSALLSRVREVLER